MARQRSTARRRSAARTARTPPRSARASISFPVSGTRRTPPGRALCSLLVPSLLTRVIARGCHVEYRLHERVGDAGVARRRQMHVVERQRRIAQVDGRAEVHVTDAMVIAELARQHRRRLALLLAMPIAESVELVGLRDDHDLSVVLQR